MSAPAPPRTAGLVRVFRHRNYRLFFAGQLVSLVGTWTQSVAQAWLVYRLTGSPLWLGVMTFCQQAPVFFLATAGGLLADRFSRRAVMVCTQTAAMLLAFALATLTLTGVVQLAHVLTLGVLLGVVNAADIPARQSFVVEMVGKEDLAPALALNSSMVHAARALGPAVAGYAIAAFGEGTCFLVNGVSFLAVIAGLLAMRGLPPAAPVAPGSARARVLEGFRFVATAPRVRTLLLLFGVTGLTAMPYTTLLPVFASRVLHGDARTLGLLMGATGAGAVVGAVLLSARRGGAVSEAWVGRACATFGATLVLLAATHSLVPSVAVLVPLGAAMMVQMSATNTLVQLMTPDALRGRVMAVWAMIFMGFAPFGALAAGSLATAIGPARTLVVGGSVCIAASLVFRAWLGRNPADA